MSEKRMNKSIISCAFLKEKDSYPAAIEKRNFRYVSEFKKYLQDKGYDLPKIFT